MTKYLAIAVGVLVLLLGGAGLLLKWSYEANGKLKADVAARDAVIKQKEADASLSEKIIREQDAAMKALNVQVAEARQRIMNAPSTSTCGPAVRDAADSVRRLLRDPGAANP